MSFVIGKTYHFDASHQLPDHSGKCRNLHGHTYTVEVELSGQPFHEGQGFPDSGMVTDFAELDGEVGQLIAQLDHKHLNELPDLHQPPTAENVTLFLVRALEVAWPVYSASRYDADGRRIPMLSRVRVYEGESAYAEWRAI